MRFVEGSISPTLGMDCKRSRSVVFDVFYRVVLELLPVSEN